MDLGVDLGENTLDAPAVVLVDFRRELSKCQERPNNLFRRLTFCAWASQPHDPTSMVSSRTWGSSMWARLSGMAMPAKCGNNIWAIIFKFLLFYKQQCHIFN